MVQNTPRFNMDLPCRFVNSWLKNPTIEAVAMLELVLLTYPSLKILAPPAEYQLTIGQKIIVIAHNANRLCHRAIAGEYRGFQQGCHVLDTTDYRHLREFPKRSVPRNIVHFWPSSPPELAFDFHENYLLIVSEK